MFAHFHGVGYVLYLTLKEDIPNNWVFLDPSLYNHLSCDSSKQIPEQVTVSSVEVSAYDPTFCFFTSSQNAEFYHLVVAAAKVVSSFYIPHLFFLVCKFGIQQEVFPSTAP